MCDFMCEVSRRIIGCWSMMETVKKWLNDRNLKKDGLYVHYSPPKLLGVVASAQLRQWVREGDGSRLERAVLAGQGRRLLSEGEALRLSRHLPALVAKCDALHAAVERGSLLELQELLEPDYNKRKCVMCRDEAGVGLLHKAVFYDFMDIAEWLVNNYPQLVNQRDSAGRTPLHYVAVCRDEAAMAALLEGAGAARGARDAAGRTPAHYHGAGRTHLALPATDNMARDPARNPKGLVIKRHNIRIWCHDCDMKKLQRVVWEGHGAMLLSEVSSQPVVRKFLEAVPYIMNTIRDIHAAVVHNNLEELMKHAGEPVPPVALSCRDANYMTVMHKAAGLGYNAILKYITDRYADGINAVDGEGRTPLHYAAAVRDDRHTYNTLVSLGADEGALDHKNKTPGYYVNRQQEIDKNLLKTIPEAPRTASSAYPSSWDWKLLDTELIQELHKKSRRKTFKVSNENISSNNTTTNTVSESTKESRTGAMKTSSTHELIKGLPDLDDMKKSQEDLLADVKDSEVVEESNEPESEDVNPNPEKDLCPEEETREDETGDDESNKVDENNEEHNVDPTEQDEIKEEDKNIENNDEEVVGNGNQEEETQSHKNETQEENVDQIENNSNDDVEEVSPVDENEVNEDSDHKESNEVSLQENGEAEETNHENPSQAEKEDDEQGEDEEEKIDENDTKNKVEHITENGDKNPDTAASEGNNNEDDDDVQIPGDTQSEYSESNLRSTAEASDAGSAKRGYQSNGPNTQESLIEGLVSADAELDSQDASVEQKEEPIKGDVLVVDSEIDPEVTELINSSNMEMLAALVLNGEGARLIGRHSRNVELQAFLDNVPSYMKKIHKVHAAAREGNIRDLQAALDRRKFAIARDPGSPNGATPLHIATIFGKTNIMKYLGGRFPETLSAVDFEGRSALHYAAVLPDNGHYYNLLQHLGANSNDLDDSGRSAEDYYKNPTLLPFDQLVSDFGISDDALQDMLSDKVPEDQVSSRRSLDVPEALDTLERCFRLLASARPSRTPLSASSNKATPPVFLGRFLKKPVFDAIKHRITRLDHDLFDVIWPAVKKLPNNKNIVQTVEEDFPGGITAPDYYVYSVFHEFLIPLIKDLHNMNVHSELTLHPPSDYNSNNPIAMSKSSEPLIELNIDPSDEFVLSGTMECMRNLDSFELPLNLTINQLEDVERILTSAFMQEEFAKLNEQSNPESDQKGGTYYTLIEVLEKPSEVCAALASAGLLISLCNKEEIDDATRLHGRHWPYGRGVYVSDDKTIAVWINVHDHIRILISTPTDSPGEIGLPFSRLSYIMAYLHKRLRFVWAPYLGHLSSRPNFLGAGIRFSLIVSFPGLSKDAENMKHLCAMRGLQYRETLSADIARVSNYQCLSVTESNCFNDFSTAVSNLLHLEKDLSLASNSAHIATMLTNIFKRKRSSLADIEDPEKQ